MVTCYDPTTSAAYFSQFAGVLAGFAFLAIIFIVERSSSSGTGKDASSPTDANEDVGHVAFAFVCSFIALVIATFLFAVTSGEELTVRSFGAFSIASLCFGVATMSLLSSLLLLFQHVGITPLARFTKIAVLAAPPLAFGYGARTTLDIRHVAAGSLKAANRSLLFLVAACFLILVTVTVGLLALAISGRLKTSSLEEVNKRVQLAAVFLCLLAAAGNGLLSAHPGNFEVSATFLSMAIVMSAIYFGGVSVVIALTSSQ